MAFIHKYSTISKGNTFNQGIIDGCINSKIATEITHPDYKDIITGINLRRMSVIVKMGLANTIKCSSRNKIDAIVVATGFASLHNSELFLCSLIDPEQSILSPTPFINSVHNTISGEIALHTQNKGYNITYSQGSLSFEGALLDSILLTKEGKNVIVGGVDEVIPPLDNLSMNIKSKEEFTTGSTFFNISPNKNGSLAEIVNCIITKEEKANYYITDNFNSNEDVLISGHSTCNHSKKINTLNYSKFSGILMTNPAFGLQLAVELLNTDISELDGCKLPSRIKRVFIINHASKNDIGIIILRK